MPTLEAIAPGLTPKEPEKVIPTRTVTTKPAKLDAGQQITNTSPAAESAPTAESVKLAPQLTAIARKEQAFRQREQALKERENAVASQIAEAEKFKQLKEKLTAKDYSEAEALGLNYEDYVKYQIDKQGEVDPRAEEIKALRQQVDALQKGTEQAAVEQFETTVEEYRKETAKLVSEDPRFSTIKGLKAEEAVIQLILDTFNEEVDEKGNPIELTILEAAELVEKQLEERGKVFTSLPKFKPVIEDVPRRTLPRPMVGKTLTNDMTAGTNNRPNVSLYKMSEAERYAEARRRVEARKQKG